MPEETSATCKSTPETGSPSSPGRGGATRWRKGQSGNPAGRRPGAVSDALRELRSLALEKAIPKLEELVDAGDVDAVKFVVAHALPRLKPVQVAEPIPLPEEASLSGHVLAALRLAAMGEISTETAGEIASIAMAAARVEEISRLREEVDDLRALLEARNQ